MTRRSQRGISTSVQAVLILPAFFSLFLWGLQWGLHSWASAVALAAAQEGARVACAHQAGLEEGLSTAEKAINRSALPEAQVSGIRSATTISVTVTGRSLSLVPGWAPQVNKTVSSSIERLTK